MKIQTLSTDYCLKFTILGEPASKANSRKAVFWGKRPAFIKSDKALNYSESFAAQCPTLETLLECDVQLVMTIFYASRRPDLDESLILDLMQGKIYRNDRQVKLRTTAWGLSPLNPRMNLEIRPYEVPAELLEIPNKKKGKAGNTAKLQSGKP